jgi:hypothetical protein
MVPMFFLIAMAVTVVTLFFVMGVAVPMVVLPFFMGVMPMAMSAAVTMVAVAGGMTWRPHGHCQQDDRGHNVQNSDVNKGRFDTVRVKQIAGDEWGSSGKSKSRERENPQRAGYYPLSNGVQGSRG